MNRADINIIYIPVQVKLLQNMLKTWPYLTEPQELSVIFYIGYKFHSSIVLSECSCCRRCNITNVGANTNATFIYHLYLFIKYFIQTLLE